MLSLPIRSEHRHVFGVIMPDIASIIVDEAGL
jgi:hypothetical protein